MSDESKQQEISLNDATIPAKISMRGKVYETKNETCGSVAELLSWKLSNAAKTKVEVVVHEQCEGLYDLTILCDKKNVKIYSVLTDLGIRKPDDLEDTEIFGND